jgi:hypothetical protein
LTWPEIVEASKTFAVRSEVITIKHPMGTLGWLLLTYQVLAAHVEDRLGFVVTEQI